MIIVHHQHLNGENTCFHITICLQIDSIWFWGFGGEAKPGDTMTLHTRIMCVCTQELMFSGTYWSGDQMLVDSVHGNFPTPFSITLAPQLI